METETYTFEQLKKAVVFGNIEEHVFFTKQKISEIEENLYLDVCEEFERILLSLESGCGLSLQMSCGFNGDLPLELTLSRSVKARRHVCLCIARVIQKVNSMSREILIDGNDQLPLPKEVIKLKKFIDNGLNRKMIRLMSNDVRDLEIFMGTLNGNINK